MRNQKGNFKPGDLCVYFEIDSYLPVKPEFEFLRPSCFKVHPDTREEGFRLKTVKLRGALSQGLALPINTFDSIKHFRNGQDVTEILGVKKYERVQDLKFCPQTSDNFEPFPSFIPRTDAERIQNITKNQRDLFKMDKFEITEKLDGQSMTVYKANDHIGVCSRNIELKESSNNALWKAAKQTIETLKVVNKNLAIQGELIGSKIQGNPYQLPNHEFRIFNIFDIENQLYLSSDFIEEFTKQNNLLRVPLIGCDNILNKELSELLDLAEGNSVLNPKVIKEGIVCKNSMFRFKVINNNYLLKGK